jgi:adenylylsulfate kinase-like enzyme
MSWAIWITGVPGSGKSVLAQAVAAELRALGEPVRVLEKGYRRPTWDRSSTADARGRAGRIGTLDQGSWHKR